jgi:hypothetical protein
MFQGIKNPGIKFSKFRGLRDSGFRVFIVLRFQSSEPCSYPGKLMAMRFLGLIIFLVSVRLGSRFFLFRGA